ncbi:DUF3310 domain-containing protein [Weissella ceti]|uniref:DUF3310 domain-containing protein n=1 Tax=Weissella ceti TaxID=759620 RepID=A0ABT3E5T9_9LACO|nr:DUF3310 domain-containing protein [Weissella ceti]MCW0953263.1 DUF3310 domain-containing protein [Weissella ceti]QVK11373.1 DUF3310 domain-containing protein [Weissella ceti]
METINITSCLSGHDPVTKPAGYQLASGNELKDVLPELVGRDDTIAFYRGSAIKYLMRYRAKNIELKTFITHLGTTFWKLCGRLTTIRSLQNGLQNNL